MKDIVGYLLVIVITVLALLFMKVTSDRCSDIGGNIHWTGGVFSVCVAPDGRLLPHE